MNRKSLLRFVLLSITILTVSATAFAALDSAAAQQIARQWVPEGAVHLGTKDDVDDNEYEVKFLNEATNTKYQIEISKATEAVTEVKTKLQDDPGSLVVLLAAEDIRNIVLSEFPDAVIQKIELEKEQGYQKYEVKFTAGTVRGELEVNPQTGAIIERELKY